MANTTRPSVPPSHASESEHRRQIANVVNIINQTTPDYSRTAAEISAGVTPVDYRYPEGVVNRYGKNTTPGTTDMTAAVKAASDVAVAAGRGQIHFAEPEQYRITSPIVGEWNNLTVTAHPQAEIVSEIENDQTDLGAFRTRAIFETAAGSTALSNITFDGVRARSIAATGAETFLFMSVREGSNYAVRRVDYFTMRNCDVRDMKLCMGYGTAFHVHDNIAVNTKTYAQRQDRNGAIIVNHFNNPPPGVLWDAAESQAIVTGNFLKGFGCGVLIHTYYNVEDATRRVLKNWVVADNVIIGISVDDAGTGGSPAGRAGIYLASVEDGVVSGNRIQHHNDMAIDLEFCQNVIVANNDIENGSLATYWASKDILFEGNRVTVTQNHPFYVSPVRSSGGPQQNIVYRANQFVNEIPETVLATAGFVSTNYGVTFEDNLFVNTRLYLASGVSYRNTRVVNNVFVYTVDMATQTHATDEPVLDVGCSGRAVIEGNDFITIDPSQATYTPVPQTGAKAAIRLNMRRISGTPNVDPVEARIERNRIYGWPASIELVAQGSTFASWLVAVIENEYDGTFTNGQTTRHNNRVLLRDNWYRDASGKPATASPTSPPSEGNYAAGSRILLYGDSLVDEDGFLLGYQCVAEDTSSPPAGGTWREIRAFDAAMKTKLDSLQVGTGNG